MGADNKKGLSTGFIKIVALICMFIDHFAATVVYSGMINLLHPFMLKLQTLFGDANTIETYAKLADIYTYMRWVGRISFPIYCFFIVEGFLKTRNRKKYAIRLGILALVSEFVFDPAFYGKMVYFVHQNVFFTLVIGLLAIWVLDTIWAKKEWQSIQKTALGGLCSFGFFLVAELLFVDYSSFGVATIVLMYIVRKVVENRVKLWAPIVFATGVALLCLMSLSEAWAFLGLPLFFFYKGKRGWNGKWFFYFFYPVHLALLAAFCLLSGLRTFAFF